MKKAPPTPKGFRDIEPELAKKRRQVINKIVEVLEEFGFVPLETPTIEFSETLKGKYGEEERLIYQFKDRGGRELALRYDLTVPFARFIANNQNLIAKEPFRRYQIGQVFRGEKPQKGRWREFTQLDFDTVGSSDLKEDARIVACALAAVDRLGIKNRILFINDRKLFEGIESRFVVAIDKWEKIGKEGVLKELQAKGLTLNSANNLLKKIKSSQETKTIKEIRTHLPYFLKSDLTIEFRPTLARGLNYYTGAIFEMVIQGSGGGSVGGGGRYDNLIGIFAKKQIPAVGFSFGIDRIVELLPNE